MFCRTMNQNKNTENNHLIQNIAEIVGIRIDLIHNVKNSLHFVKFMMDDIT